MGCRQPFRASGQLAFIVTLLLAATTTQPARSQTSPPGTSPPPNYPAPTQSARTNTPRATPQPPLNARQTDARPIPKLTNDTAGNSDSNDKPSSAVQSFGRTLGALGLILALIFGGAALLKKHAPASVTGLPTEAVEVLGRRGVHQRQSVVLVRCGSKILILASTPDGLSLLSEVSDPIEVDYLAGLCRHDREESSVINTFRQLLAKAPSPDVSAPADGAFPTPRSEHFSAADTPDSSIPQVTHG